MIKPTETETERATHIVGLVERERDIVGNTVK